MQQKFNLMNGFVVIFLKINLLIYYETASKLNEFGNKGHAKKIKTPGQT